jgi:spermidine/putrescine-binding protein
MLDRRLTRGEILKGAAVGALSLYAAGCGSSSSGATGAVTMNWLTWADHYTSPQIDAIKRETGVSLRPTLFSDDSEALLKLKATDGQYDMSSVDALWVPEFLKQGLIEPFSLDEIKASSQLYPDARSLPFWKAGGDYMAYPYGWSTQQIYYDPAHVTTKPDSWHALADPKYRKRVVLLNAPTDMMAVAGLATGAKSAYDMTTAEIARAKAFLEAVKPNVLKLGTQQSDIQAALVDGTAWLAFNNLGTDVLVKQAGGPSIEVAFPKEGTIGFIDGETIVKASRNKSRFPQVMQAGQQAKWIALSFLKNGHPFFNEAAYKLLVNQGKKEQADRFFYNEPQRAVETHLKGPSKNEQGYIDAFNEVFGA